MSRQLLVGPWSRVPDHSLEAVRFTVTRGLSPSQSNVLLSMHVESIVVSKVVANGLAKDAVDGVAEVVTDIVVVSWADDAVVT